MSESTLDSKLSKLKIDKSQKRTPRGRFRWSWLVVALVVGGGGFAAYRSATAPLVVRTTKIEQEPVAPGRGPALVTAAGYIVPRHKVEVSSKIIGRVVEVHVKRGDVVKEGDVLLRIEDGDFQARVAQAQAQVETLEAKLRELKAGPRAEEVAAAKAAARASAASLGNAQQELERTEALTQRGVLSAQDTDRLRATRDIAKARLSADENNARLVALGARAEVIDAAEAQLRQAQADLSLAKTELEYTLIRAPISGTVLEKLAEQGELVTNSNFGGTRGAKSSVLTMADLGDLQVEVDVNQAELAKLHTGQAAEIRLDMDPEQAYTGEVDEISPQADRQKGTVQVKVGLRTPGANVKTELNARVTFLGAADPGATLSAKPRIWIPRTAIVASGKETLVYVLSQSQVLAKPIKTGIEGEKGTEVVDGLDGSELLIVGPMDQLKPGARAQAAE